MAFVDMATSSSRWRRAARKGRTRRATSASSSRPRRRARGGAEAGIDSSAATRSSFRGQPGAGRRVRRDPVLEDTGDPQRHGPRVREDPVCAARAARQGPRLESDRHQPPFPRQLAGAAAAGAGCSSSSRSYGFRLRSCSCWAGWRWLRPRTTRDRPAPTSSSSASCAAALRCRVLHVAARPALDLRGRPADDRPRPPDDGRRRGRGPRDRPGAAVSGRVRARRRRLPHRPDRGDRDHAPPRVPGGSSRSSKARASSTTARPSSPTAPRCRDGQRCFLDLEGRRSFVLNVTGASRRPRRCLDRAPGPEGLDYPPAEVTISLLTEYFAYIPAELMGVSAVIAAVTAGIYLAGTRRS